MKQFIKDTWAVILFMVLSMGLIIFASNMARINHDNEIRQQVVQTCKEFK